MHQPPVATSDHRARLPDSYERQGVAACGRAVMKARRQNRRGSLRYTTRCLSASKIDIARLLAQAEQVA
jgi:hypothetical protein